MLKKERMIYFIRRNDVLLSIKISMVPGRKAVPNISNKLMKVNRVLKTTGILCKTAFTPLTVTRR
jgi:hypothetical protein